MRREASALKSQVERLEKTERQLKSMLIERESEIESDRLEFRRKLNAERKKALGHQEASARLREEFERRKIETTQELSVKDQLIA